MQYYYSSDIQSSMLLTVYYVADRNSTCCPSINLEYFLPEPSAIMSLYVLEIGELRERIFVNLEKTTLAKCARVCSLWSDDALNLLWNKLNSVIPLLSTIGPLHKDVQSTFTKSMFMISDICNEFRAEVRFAPLKI